MDSLEIPELQKITEGKNRNAMIAEIRVHGKYVVNLSASVHSPEYAKNEK